MSKEKQRPTNVRYLIVLITFLVAVLLYLHRFCISYMQRYLQEDLGLSDSQLAWCFSAFFIAYAAAQVPSGWLSDRFGARTTLAIYIVAWSAFTALMGFTMGFISLLLLRAAVGISQAGAYPTAASLLRRWVPFSSRGMANSFVAFGGRFGGFIAPILTVYLVIAFVPLDVSSTIQRADILNAHRLAFELVEASEPLEAEGESTASERAVHRARQQVFEQLSDRGKESAEGLAASYDSEADEESARMPQASSQELKLLAEELNSVVSGESLYREDDFRHMEIEREAKRLASEDSLSKQQRTRLNRLLLEGLFPESIRKIYVHGWRQVMFVYGGVGILVVGIYLFVFRDRPSEHPWCNQAEQELIEEGQPTATPKKVGGVPLGAIVKSRSMWLMCVNQFGGNVGWAFLMTWLPRYLLEVHDTPFIQRGWMAAVPLSVGWIGMLLGGWLTDLCVKKLGLRWRVAPIVFGRMMATAAYLSCLFVPSARAATAAFAMIAFFNDLCNPSSWSYKQDVGGRYVGAILGWSNMWGNFGAALSPVLFQFIFDQYSWNAMFVAGATAFFIAGLASIGIDATIPVDPEAARVAASSE